MLAFSFGVSLKVVLISVARALNDERTAIGTPTEADEFSSSVTRFLAPKGLSKHQGALALTTDLMFDKTYYLYL